MTARTPAADRPPMPEPPQRRPAFGPSSTYRVQLHAGFGFADARRIVPYLARLGVGAFYSSPYMMARPGSGHGYDVTDHNRLNPELGSEANYDALTEALREHGLGHVLDFVPNHMGIHPEVNPWWRDVLENGSCSPFARYFDIDWAAIKPELTGKVLLPVLDDQYGQVLDRGALQVRYEDGVLVLDCQGLRVPVNPRQFPVILGRDLERLRTDLGEDDPHLLEFLSILSALHHMPPYTERDPDRVAERQREKTVARVRLRRVVEASPRIRRHMDEAIRAMNGRAGEPASFDALHRVLEAQPYRLAHWRTALHEINYRRFFDINDLAGLRVEDPQVFAATHRLIRRLIAEGRITGVRVDHPDGLYDPGGYFARLQELARQARLSSGPDGSATPLYLLGEKILSTSERLPETWPIHGTTGYNFLHDVNGLFIDRTAEATLRAIYVRFTGRTERFADVLYESKKLIMETALASELNVLADELNRISEQDRRSRDFTLNSLYAALREVVACFPVYRTYVTEAGWNEHDRLMIELAIRRALYRNPVVEPSIFDFVRDILMPVRGLSPDGAGGRPDVRYPAATEADYQRRLQFSVRLQQYTGPVQAKGLEDTAFYRYHVLVSLNEVGGDAERFGRTSAEYHAMARERRSRWPYEMVATSTHDTKLGEDVRTRIDALTEMTGAWERGVAEWAELNEPYRTDLEGEWAPERNDEYRFYQVLVGAWPPALAADIAPPVPDVFVRRMRDYMLKAVKEAKRHTSWINVNRAYDDATARFVEGCLTGPRAAEFRAAFLPVQQQAARLGLVNSLSQVVLKILSPGVPDFYQGAELWDLNLVDPDNRRPVDFALRAQLLDEVEPLVASPTPQAVQRLLEAWPDGRIKLFVTAVCLHLRRRRPDLLIEGDYVALEDKAMVPAGLLSFARLLRSDAAVVLVPRLVARITSDPRPFPLGRESWADSRVLLTPALAGHRYANLFTGERVEPVASPGGPAILVRDALASCPVAVLIPVS